MGFFDSYEPAGSFACPACGLLLRNWQGYNGPCGWFLFREGVAGAVDQPIAEECRLSDPELFSIRLPDEFFISARDCECPFPTKLRCTASDGVWRHSELFTGTEEDLRLRGEERREHWQARRKWLGKK
jgi:hypothetical protein